MSTVNVKVVLRVRPLNKKEIERGGNICLKFVNQQTVKIKFSEEQERAKSSESIPDFNFDHVFPMDTKQENVFDIAARPVIESVFEGFNGTIFAYGQTSSGKTHTMQGPNIDDQEMKGIIPRMVDYIFDKIYDSPEHIEFKIKISAVEIYMEKIRDLLREGSNHNLQIREDKQKGIYIQDAQESYVSDQSDIYKLLQIANLNRAVAHTNMNEGSSRSHMVFIMTIQKNNTQDNSCVMGKLSLIDLAGSEKIEKTGATGSTLEEAKLINKSLSELGNVINALTDKNQTHIPYRNSKLTRLLQESLGGNARTTLIITASPSPYNELETLSTLRFGSRAKSIENKAVINKEWTVNELLQIVKKKDQEIAFLVKRVQILEDYIQSKGLEIPQSESKEEKEIKQKKQDEEDIEALYSNISELKEQNQSLEDDLNSERKIIQEKNQEIDNLRQQLQEKINELEDKLLEKEAEDREKQIKINQEYKDLQEEYEQTQKDNKELIQEMNKQKKEIQEIQEKMKQQSEEIISNELEEIQNQKQSEQIIQLEQDKEELMKKQTKQSEKLQAIENELNEKVKQIEVKEQEIEETKKELEQIKFQLNTLLGSKDGEKLDAMRKEFQNQNQEMKEQLDKKGEQLDQVLKYLQENQDQEKSQVQNNEEIKNMFQEQFKRQQLEQEEKQKIQNQQEEKNKEYEQKIQNLEEKLQQQQNQYDKDLQVIINQKIEVESELIELKHHIKDKKGQEIQKKDKLSNLKNQISKFTEQMQAQILQNENLKYENEKLQIQKKRDKNLIEELNKDLHQLKEKYQARYTKLKEENSKLKNQTQNTQTHMQLIQSIQQKYGQKKEKNNSSYLSGSRIIKPIQGKKVSESHNTQQQQLQQDAQNQQ